MPSVPLNLKYWDLEFDGVAIELDECLHFNRYRALTLGSEAYAALPRFPVVRYKDYCLRHEGVCLKNGSYGQKWSSRSCERQFGEAAPRGSLSGNGSPRWKQRAFYDFVKDLSDSLIGVKVARVAVWDVLADGRTVEQVLNALVSRSAPISPRDSSAVALAELISERVV